MRGVCCRFALPSDSTLGTLPRAVRHALKQRVRQPSEGPLLAASRSTSAADLNPRRISFAKIKEPLEVPKLLDLQTTSFDWLVGNEAWKAQVARRQEAGEAPGPSDLLPSQGRSAEPLPPLGLRRTTIPSRLAA